jgi:predicted nucleic acid-binding protein
MLYLDTSATAKLLVEEPESAALRELLGAAAAPLVTSRIGIVELRRVGRRIGLPDERADAISSALTVVELDETIERWAVDVEPGLGTLDSIHLATALVASRLLRGFVCYDVRLAAAAAAHELPVLAPA